MKIALIGYGRMGQAIEQLALDRGHQIVAKVSEDSDDSEAYMVPYYGTCDCGKKH